MVPKASNRAAQVNTSTNNITVDKTWAVFLYARMAVLRMASEVFTCFNIIYQKNID